MKLIDIAPVLVWIYGGGYTGGAKDASSYLPPGLLNAAKQEDSKGEGFVYIALNYRLGLFGWLAGPTFQIDGNANNGLYDQRLALEWVQKYAPLFGGDPNRVTVMGESAGGGSILHQITAYGGLRGPVPFQQAIPQSPAFQALPSPLQQEDSFQKTLGYASAISNTTVTTLAQLRALPSSVLYAVNAYTVALSNYGTFTYGPAVDGKFVPALPGTLLLHNQFDSSVKVMVGHNLNESFIFTSPFVANNTQLEEVFSELVPSLSPSIASYIENVLYPPVFDGSYGYYDDDIRASLAIAESTFTCNTRYLDLAFKNQTYSYMFAVPPGYHGNDVTYTFYNGPPSLNPVAATFQSYLTSFALTGTPNAPGGATRPYFPMYGKNATIMDIQDVEGTQMDTVANSRCDWWQKGLYY
jgi:carboxylesterase type B